MKLDMGKFESKRRECIEAMYMPEVRKSTGMAVLNLLCVCIGVYVAYYMYIRAGIIDPLGLIAFILGITLAVIGFQRMFSSIADIVVTMQQRGRCLAGDPMATLKMGLVNGLSVDTKGLTVNILDRGIELKYSTFAECECLLDYSKVFEVLLNEKNKNIYVFFTDVSSEYNIDRDVIEGFPFGGVVLNDLLEGFDWDEVVAKLRAHVDPSRFIRVELSGLQVEQMLWDRMAVWKMSSWKADEESKGVEEKTEEVESAQEAVVEKDQPEVQEPDEEGMKEPVAENSKEGDEVSEESEDSKKEPVEDTEDKKESKETTESADESATEDIDEKTTDVLDDESFEKPIEEGSSETSESEAGEGTSPEEKKN